MVIIALLCWCCCALVYQSSIYWDRVIAIHMSVLRYATLG